MLRALRKLRVAIAPRMAGLFVLGLLMVGARSAYAVEIVGPHPPSAEEHHEDGAHHHPRGYHQPDATPEQPAPDHEGDHGCDFCLCFAATGTCSAPTLSQRIHIPERVFLSPYARLVHEHRHKGHGAGGGHR